MHRFECISEPARAFCFPVLAGRESRGQLLLDAVPLQYSFEIRPVNLLHGRMQRVDCKLVRVCNIAFELLQFLQRLTLVCHRLDNNQLALIVH